MSRFDKVLIANRGEIACRVIRSCQQLGYRTVAVYSDADCNAPHVAAADEAVHIGPSRAKESYLVVEKIVAAAKSSGAGAIHPGYGFLAENEGFARACLGAGIIFIGPGPDAIRLMGNKRQAKLRMIDAGVPCIPGYEGADGADMADAALQREARRIGFPVMVKAAAGGGGRGMRLVADEAQLLPGLQSARSEAENAFGSGELILEKAVVGARHVEIQVFADAHGNVVHLGERDCSVQRRHQKIVEESPSPAVDAELRRRMGEVAVAAARAIGYVGAGTIEFLLAPSGEFYFMEMNTRLQVEHPVTEMITGLDLVAWQLAVAAGEPLPLKQDEIRFSGHAIEVRLCAEDPARGFLPQTGKLLRFRLPDGDGVRVDHGVREGQEIGSFYDSMQAKVIAHGPTRDAARRRLVRALEELSVLGVVTNKDFLLHVLRHAAFAAGEYDTAFIPTHFPAPVIERALAPTTRHAALAAATLVGDDARALQECAGLDRELLHWNSAFAYATPLQLSRGDGERELWVRALAPGRYEVVVDGNPIEIDLRRTGAAYAREGDRLWLDGEGATHAYTDVTWRPPEIAAAGGDGRHLAPMDGKVIAVHVQSGQPVKKGQTLLVVEAMKMELQVTAGVEGTVEAINVAVGHQVSARQVLVTLVPQS